LNVRHCHWTERFDGGGQRQWEWRRVRQAREHRPAAGRRDADDRIAVEGGTALAIIGRDREGRVFGRTDRQTMRGRYENELANPGRDVGRRSGPSVSGQAVAYESRERQAVRGKGSFRIIVQTHRDGLLLPPQFVHVTDQNRGKWRSSIGIKDSDLRGNPLNCGGIIHRRDNDRGTGVWPVGDAAIHQENAKRSGRSGAAADLIGRRLKQYLPDRSRGVFARAGKDVRGRRSSVIFNEASQVDELAIRVTVQLNDHAERAAIEALNADSRKETQGGVIVHPLVRPRAR